MNGMEGNDEGGAGMRIRMAFGIWLGEQVRDGDAVKIA